MRRRLNRGGYRVVRMVTSIGEFLRWDSPFLVSVSLVFWLEGLTRVGSGVYNA